MLNTDTLALLTLAKAIGKKYNLSYDDKSRAACLWLNVSDNVAVPLAEVVYKATNLGGTAAIYGGSSATSGCGGNVTITGGYNVSVGSSYSLSGNIPLTGGSCNSSSMLPYPVYEKKLNGIELSSCIKDHLLGQITNSDFLLKADAGNSILINGTESTAIVDVRDPAFVPKSISILKNTLSLYNIKCIRTLKSKHKFNLCCK